MSTNQNSENGSPGTSAASESNKDQNKQKSKTLGKLKTNNSLNNSNNEQQNMDEDEQVTVENDSVNSAEEPDSDKTKFKQKINCVSWNIEGLIDKLNLQGFVDFLKSFDIITLGETFTLPTFNFEIKFDDYFYIHSPAKKFSRLGRPSGGLVVLVKKKWRKYIKVIDTKKNHIIAFKINKSLLKRSKDIMFIATYIHPTGSVYYTDKDYNCTLDELEDFLINVTEHDEEYDYIITGDLNARLSDWYYTEEGLMAEEEEGDENLERSARDSTINDYGKRLIELCTTFGVTPVGGLKKKNFEDRFTYIGPGGNSQIDHYICSIGTLNELENYKVINRVESKHFPITIEIYTGLQNTEKEEDNKEIRKTKWQEKKKEEVENILAKQSTVQKLREAEQLVEEDIDEAVLMFTETMQRANKPMEKNIIPNKKEQRQPWYDKECKRKKKDLKKLLNKVNCNKNHRNQKLEEQRVAYLEAKLDYNKTIKQKRKKYNQETKDKLLEDCKDGKTFWTTINRLSFRRPKLANISPERWENHFHKVYNPQNVPAEQKESNEIEDVHEITEEVIIEELDREITSEEITQTIKNLKKNKAPGQDELSAELIQTAGPKIIPFLKKLFNKIFDTGQFPSRWVDAILVPLFKKGDKNKEDNYRGISLLSIPSKILTAILNKRLYTWAERESKIPEEQAGFRRNYSTMDHIFTLYNMAGNYLYGRKRGKLYVAFIDYRKAFDSVNRDKLFEILKKQGVSTKMIRIIQGIYKIVGVIVRYGAEITNRINCPLGVRQGCLLSPLLFSMLITEVAIKVANKGRAGYQFVPGMKEIYLLLFADDIVLIGTTPMGLQNQLNSLREASEELGLEVNLSKTKVMVFRKGGFLGKREKWFYGREKIEVVNNYKYLGYTLTTKLSVDVALAEYAGRAKNKAVSIFRVLYKLGQIDIDIFFKLFDSQIKPILLYASEIWGARQFNVIEGVHMFVCRKILGVTRQTPKTFIYTELNRYPLYIDSKIRNIKYWFKLLQLGQERIPKQAYERELLEIRMEKKWGFETKKLLDTNGYGYVWLDQGVLNINSFIKSFKQRLIDQFWQETQSKIDEKERFSTYKQFKQGHEREQYLQQIKISRFRRTFTRARLGIIDINYNERFLKTENNLHCPFCGIPETEIHLLLECPQYSQLRTKFIERYWISTNSLNITDLLANKNPEINKTVAMYLFYALKRREVLIKETQN